MDETMDLINNLLRLTEEGKVAWSVHDAQNYSLQCDANGWHFTVEKNGFSTFSLTWYSRQTDGVKGYTSAYLMSRLGTNFSNLWAAANQCATGRKEKVVEEQRSVILHQANEALKDL